VTIIKTSIETLRQAMQNSKDGNIVALEKKLTDKQLAMLRGLYRLSMQANNQQH
jgi:hypothetical protein